MNNQEIARLFDTGLNTVANRRTSILKKSVKNTVELISPARCEESSQQAP